MELERVQLSQCRATSIVIPQPRELRPLKSRVGTQEQVIKLTTIGHVRLLWKFS